MTLEELDRLEKHSTCGPMRIHAGYVPKSDFPHLATLGTDNRTTLARFADASEANVTAAARNALPQLLAVAKAAMTMLEESTPVPNVEAIQVQQKYVEKLVKALAEMEKA